MSTVEQQVKAIVAEQLGVKQEQVTNDASFVDDLGADSLDTVELVMALEEESRSRFPMRTPRKSPRSSRPSSTSTIAVPKPDRSASWVSGPVRRGRSVIVHPGPRPFLLKYR